MASIGKAIFANLNANAAVTAITATIVPSTAPKRKTYPQVIYEVKGTEEDQPYGGGSVAKGDFTIKCICKSSYTDKANGYKQCDALANAVGNSLKNQAGTFGGITVQRFFLNDDVEDEFQDQESEEILYFERELSFEAWFNL